MTISLIQRIKSKIGHLVLTIITLSMLQPADSFAFAKIFHTQLDLSNTFLSYKIQDKSGNSLNPNLVDLSQKYNSAGLGLLFSFDVWRWLSIEFGLRSLGSSKFTSTNPERKSGNINFTGTTAYFSYSYPVSKHGLQYHGKLGFFNLSQNSNLSYVTQSNQTGISFGGSTTYHLRNGWGGGAALYYHSASLQVITLGVSKRWDLVTKTTRLSQQMILKTEELQDVIQSGSETFRSIMLNTTNTPPPKFIPMTKFSSSLSDSDNDGVPDSLDKCPSTPAGGTTNNDGCTVVYEEFFNSNVAENDNLLYPDDAILLENKDVVEDINRSFRRSSDQNNSEISQNIAQNFGANSFRRNEGLDVEDLLGISLNAEPLGGELESRSQGLDSAAVAQNSLMGNLSSSVFGTAKSLLDIATLGATAKSGSDPFENLIQSQSNILNSAVSIATLGLVKGAAVTERKQQDLEFSQNMDELKKEIEQQNSSNSEDIFNTNNLGNGQGNSSLNQDSSNEILPQIDSTGLGNNQRNQLSSIAANLRKNRNQKIELSKYLDSNSNSQQQIDSIRDYLIENGVNTQQIEFNESSNQEPSNSVN